MFYILAQLTAFCATFVINIVFKMKVSVLGPFSHQFISILNQIKFHGNFTSSMASMVAWTSMEIIGRILWTWSPIAPWIPHKLSVEYMETNRKRRTLMPLNYPLFFWKSMEM